MEVKLELAELSKLSFTELKRKYPNIKSNSKKGLLSKIETELENIKLVVEESELNNEELVEDYLTWKTVKEYIRLESKSSNKILITCPTTIEADLVFRMIKEELFPILHDEEITIMASSSRRDMHLNGTCYCRLVCQSNSEHLKAVFKYNVFKDLV